MRIISHRGNLNGPNEQRENSIEYIEEAIKAGFDVEIDLWQIDGAMFLGHNIIECRVKAEFLLEHLDKLWIHCKNVEAIDECFRRGLNGFWHEEDKHTITVHGYNWTYRNNRLGLFNSVAVLPELAPDWDISKAWGVCTDFPLKYKELYGQG